MRHILDYNCPDCRRLVRFKDAPDEPQRCKAHLYRDERRRNPTALPPIYVVCYGIDRCYGGREEGGWWYDAVHIQEAHKVWTFRDARRLIRRLKEEYPPHNRIYRRDGTYWEATRFDSNGGTDHIIALCRDPSEFPEETTHKPRYE